MSIVKFAVICDICKERQQEYAFHAAPMCSCCEKDICKSCDPEMYVTFQNLLCCDMCAVPDVTCENCNLVEEYGF